MSRIPAVVAAVGALGLLVGAMIGGGTGESESSLLAGSSVPVSEGGSASVSVGRQPTEPPFPSCPPGMACAQPVGGVRFLDEELPDISTLALDLSGVTQLTEAQMRAVLWAAGWPPELHEEALTIAWCESRWRAGAIGDNGAAYGLYQIHARDTAWRSKAQALGDPLDPVVNARLALHIYELRGRWGGRGGWGRCAAGAGLW